MKKEIKEIDKNITGTELNFEMLAESRKRIYKYLMSGKWKGQRIEVEIGNLYEPFGIFICEIKEWKPNKKIP